MKSMAEKAGLPELNQGKRLTNTSVRKRLCQKLLQSNVPDTVAVHVTGHRNPNSLNNYRTLTPLQQKSMSNILASDSSSTTSSMTNALTGCCPSASMGFPVNNALGSCAQPAIESSVPVSAPIHDHALVDGFDVPSQSLGSCSSVRKTSAVVSQRRITSSQAGSNIVPYLFQNATITGGTINITINTGSGNKRKQETESDSLSQEIVTISQENSSQWGLLNPLEYEHSILSCSKSRLRVKFSVRVHVQMIHGCSDTCSRRGGVPFSRFFYLFFIPV